MFFGMSAYQALWYFLLYSFAGWVLEVIYHAVAQGKIVNRGFLCGPVCPVYGFGVLSVFALAYFAGESGQGARVEELTLWQLFLGGVVLATLVELIAGFLLDRLFHARWWDYSDKPFNLHGYICPEFSLIWGLCIAFVVRDLQPYVRGFFEGSSSLPERIGWPLLGIAYAVYLADLVVTVLSVNRLNRGLAEISKLRASMRVVSDGMTRVIGGGALRTAEAVEAEREKARAQVERRQEELYDRLQRERFFGTGRLIRAFPEMRHRRYDEALRGLQERLRERRRD